MYCVRFTVVFLLCLPAIGCQTIPEAIPQAEAIVMEHPDSAVRLLQGIPAPAKNLSRRNYARYASPPPTRNRHVTAAEQPAGAARGG